MDDFNLVEWILQNGWWLLGLFSGLYGASRDMLAAIRARWPIAANIIQRALIGAGAGAVFLVVLSLLNDAIHERSVTDEVLEALARIESKHQKDVRDIAGVQIDIIFKEITRVREELNLVNDRLLEQRENMVNHIIIDHDPEKEEATRQQPSTTPPIP